MAITFPSTSMGSPLLPGSILNPNAATGPVPSLVNTPNPPSSGGGGILGAIDKYFGLGGIDAFTGNALRSINNWLQNSQPLGMPSLTQIEERLGASGPITAGQVFNWLTPPPAGSSSFMKTPFGKDVKGAGQAIFGGGKSKPKAAPVKPDPLIPYVPSLQSGFGAGGTAGQGAGTSSAIDPNIVNRIVGAAQPITYNPATYNPVSVSMPTYQSSYPYAQHLLAQGTNNALRVLQQNQAAVNAFGKYIQNLPDLTGAAQQQAIAMLAPQIQAALTGGANQADAINALGQAASDLQQRIGANVSNAYNSSGQLLSALSGALGSTIAGATNQGLAAIPTPGGAQSALAAGMAPGGFSLNQLAPGAAGGLQALQGTIPAVGLTSQGQNAQQAAQDTALTLLGGAGHLGMAALAAANTKASDLAAQLPTLENQAFSQLSTQQANQTSAMKDYLTTQLGLSDKEATAYINAAKTSASAWQKDVGSRNTFVNQQANTNARIATANASGQNRTDIANQRLAVSVASDNAANRSRELRNYFTYIKQASGGTGGSMTSNEFESAANKVDAWMQKVLGAPAKTTTTVGPSGTTTRTTPAVPKTPVNTAWARFQAAFPKLQQYSPQAFINTFKTYYKLPDAWTATNIATNWGPIGVKSNGQPKMGTAQSYWKAGGGRTNSAYATGGGATGSRGQSGGNAATQSLTYSTPVPFTGVTTQGIQPSLLSKISQAAAAVGATSIVITSGKRAPGPGNDVQNSNHITGNAMDGYAIINGKRVPLGTAIKSVAGQYGLRSGDQAGFDPKTQGGYDPIHVDDGANVNGGKPLATNINQLPYTGQNPGFQLLPSFGGQPDYQLLSQNTTMSGIGALPQSAQLAYQLGIQAGLSPQEAIDFAGVQMGESNFNPNATNKSSGAAGLYQLLSPGYVNTANQLGGVYNPTANINAILPNYVSYYQSHPFVPGAAGASVEASGQPASYYARGTSYLNQLLGYQ